VGFYPPPTIHHPRSTSHLRELIKALNTAGVRLEAGWTAYDGTLPRVSHAALLEEAAATAFAGAEWRVETVCTAVAGDAFDLRVRFAVARGQAQGVAVGVGLAFDRWSLANYVLMPAAVYAANRFHAAPCSCRPARQPLSATPGSCSRKTTAARAPACG
jgi:hypothetical protein